MTDPDDLAAQLKKAKAAARRAFAMWARNAGGVCAQIETIAELVTWAAATHAAWKKVTNANALVRKLEAEMRARKRKTP